MFAVHVPVITTLAAGLLGILFIVLSALTVMSRAKAKIMIGTGDNTNPEENQLLTAVRAHANFAEYTPLALGLIALMEMRTGPTGVVKFLALALVLARFAHGTACI